MANQFIYCPQCDSPKVVSSDFDDDEDALECEDCGWQGQPGELVCKDDEPGPTKDR